MDKFALPRKNILILIIGLVVMVLGYILMTGGGSDSPNEFNYQMFNFRRLTLAPLLIIIGVGLEIYGIMKRPKETKEKENSK